MLCCFKNLPDKMKEAYSFVLDDKNFLEELQAGVGTVRHVEDCKT